MDDLISRQAAIDMIEKYFDGLPIAVHHDMLAMIHRLPTVQPEPLTLRVNRELTKEEYDKLMRDIKNAPVVLLPSVQQEIIRCKDCKYYTSMWYCEAWNNSPGFPAVCDDMFCSLAERREDG